jgi:hypothetical protein
MPNGQTSANLSEDENKTKIHWLFIMFHTKILILGYPIFGQSHINSTAKQRSSAWDVQPPRREATVAERGAR